MRESILSSLLCPEGPAHSDHVSGRFFDSNIALVMLGEVMKYSLCLDSSPQQSGSRMSF